MSLRLRRGTDGERLAITPEAGELIFTTDTKTVFVGDGATQGGIVVSAGGVTLADLGDTNIVSVQDGDLLGYNASASKWEATRFVDTDITGSVFAKDSGVLVDANAGLITGTVSTDAVTASGTAVFGGTGMIGFISLINDGSGYVTAPAVEISPPPSGEQATAVAITTSSGGVKSLKEIRILNPGSGYDINNPPLIILNGGGGAGAAVTFGIVDSGISTITVSNRGSGYSTTPTVTFTNTFPHGGTDAVAESVITDDGRVKSVQFINVGSGYVTAPTVTFSGISTTGIGTYIYNEIVTGSISGTTARVKNFKKRVDIDNVNPPVELQVSLNSGKFNAGEVIVGSISSARYVVESYSDDSFEEPFDSNKEIEDEALNLLDFTENNPFGDYWC